MQLETNSVEPLGHDRRPTELYETHGRAISRYLRVHGLSLEDTEDLLVEIFLPRWNGIISPHSLLENNWHG